MQEDKEYKADIGQYLFHLRELNKIHAKMLDDHNRDIQQLKTDHAVLKSKVENFRIENVEQVIVQKPRATTKEIVQTGSVGAILVSVIWGVAKAAYEYWKGAQ